MDLKQELGRIGVTIVKVEQKPDQIHLMLRVDPKRAGLWNEALTEYLLASIGQEETWATDVSKKFYPVPDSGVVRFLWRVILSKSPKDAAEALGNAVRRSLAGCVEVKSYPLVGRKNYVLDPESGKMAGAHDPTVAARLRAQGIGQ